MILTLRPIVVVGMDYGRVDHFCRTHGIPPRGRDVWPVATSDGRSAMRLRGRAVDPRHVFYTPGWYLGRHTPAVQRELAMCTRPYRTSADIRSGGTLPPH